MIPARNTEASAAIKRSPRRSSSALLCSARSSNRVFFSFLLSSLYLTLRSPGVAIGEEVYSLNGRVIRADTKESLPGVSVRLHP
jgi:hypothetical protein